MLFAIHGLDQADATPGRRARCEAHPPPVDAGIPLHAVHARVG